MSDAGQISMTRPTHIQSMNQGKEYIPEPYKDMARGMEKQFLEFMIEQMNKTTQLTEPSSTAANYYKDLLTGERADKMARNHEGMGIQDIILDQIYPKEKRNRLAYQAYLKAMQSQGLRNNPHNEIKLSK